MNRTLQGCRDGYVSASDTKRIDGHERGCYPTRVLVRFAKLVLVLSLSLSFGLHWVLLQSVGWTGMMIRYSENGSLTEALAKTFDGKHPCGICKIVKTGRQSGQQPESQLLKVKIDFFVQTSRQFLFPSPVFATWQISLPANSQSPHSPPAPPPRILVG